jgi:hypothetical protein
MTAGRPKGSGSPVPVDGFEISATDLKPSVAAQAANAFTLRDEAVMLAADVALIFGVETREIVQNIKTNRNIFPDKYAFELTPDEVAGLTSAGLISKPGRGGRRALPWAVTRKGALRLATIMKTPRAIQATDVFIDVFDEIIGQMEAGRGRLTVSEPSRLIQSEADRTFMAQLRGRLVVAVDSLLNTVIEPNGRTTVADELRTVAAEAVNHIKAWLKGKSVANDKIEAETLLIIQQAQDIFERRQADLAEKALDRERKALENLRLRIEAVREVMALHRQLEPSALVELTRGFAAPLALSAPSPTLPSASAAKDDA